MTTAMAMSGSMGDIVAALCAPDGLLDDPRLAGDCGEPLPSRDAVVAMMDDLRAVLFPGYFGTTELSPESRHFHVGALLDRVTLTLREQVRRALCFAETEAGVPHGELPRAGCQKKSEAVTAAFIARLPEVRRKLSSDVMAAFNGDPALRLPGEAILCYPGVIATTSYRIAHELHVLGVPLLPRLISEQAHSVTGIDIHPGATIGDAFFIDHGTGVVIGETCIIGSRVCIYQGVTLGAKSFPKDEAGHPIKGIPRHPIVEDDVIIYSGATILGRVTIGRGSVIGGNVWLTRTVGPQSRISQAATRDTAFEAGAGI